MESDREYKDIKADNVEAEKVFIGICEECSKDAEEDYSKVCPSCGAIYHEECAPGICTMCELPLDGLCIELEDEDKDLNTE